MISFSQMDRSFPVEAAARRIMVMLFPEMRPSKTPSSDSKSFGSLHSSFYKEIFKKFLKMTQH